MGDTFFASPAAAERAFYEAIEKSDLEAMMAVWDQAPDILCIHPLGPRLTGTEQVREGWRRIFASGVRLAFTLTGLQPLEGRDLVLRIVQENITVLDAQEQPAQPITATNGYRRTARGWRMVLHHASPGPAAPGSAPERRLH